MCHFSIHTTPNPLTNMALLPSTFDLHILRRRRLFGAVPEGGRREKEEGLAGVPEGKRCRIQSATRFCKADKPNAQKAAKAAPQRIYVPLKNSRLIAYRIGIRVKSTAYGSTLPIASMTAVTRNGLTPHRYAPRKYSVSFSATAGSRSPSK